MDDRRIARRTAKGCSAISWRGFSAEGDDHIIFRRNLINNTAPYVGPDARDQAGIYLEVTNSLIEENEIYSFSRWGMILRNGSYSSNPVGNNTIRRNYINWRNYPNSSNGSTCLGTYPSQGNVFENNITEGANGCDTSFTPLLVGGANSSGNSFYGNISIGHNISFQTGVGSSGGPTTSDDVTFENNIAISSEATHSPAGGYGRRITHRNYSAFADSAIRTDAFVEGFEVGYDSRMLRIADPSAECTNCLLYGAWPAGFYIDTNEVPNFKLDFPAVYNVGTPFSPDASDPRITNEIALTSAELGSCKAYIPDSATSLKGKGKNGADIGANILYVYENGVLTNKPLWNPQTGEFPHGAIVPRLNDIPGQSLFNIHQRLNVNTNGCPFPQGYGGSWPPGEAVAEGGPAGTVAFHILDSSQAVPTGFGASYNVLSSAQELLLKANCTDTSVSYPVGNGSQTQYIYNQGYYWTGTAWSPFTFSCNNLISSAWCVGNANFTRNMTATELANTNYYVACV